MESIFIIIFPIFFIIMWFVTMKFLKAKMGLVNSIEEEKGRSVSESSWGSGRINGISLKNCLKILEYENGFILKIMPLFGGGMLWIPKESFKIVIRKEKSWLAPESTEITSGNHKLRFYAALSKQFK